MLADLDGARGASSATTRRSGACARRARTTSRSTSSPARTSPSRPRRSRARRWSRTACSTSCESLDARAARALPRAAARRAARVHADRRQRALDRRDPLRPPRLDAADRQRALPAVDDRQGRRARHPRADRDAQPGARQAAAGAHRPRARDPRARHPAAVRRLDGVLGRPGADRARRASASARSSTPRCRTCGPRSGGRSGRMARPTQTTLAEEFGRLADVHPELGLVARHGEPAGARGSSSRSRSRC